MIDVFRSRIERGEMPFNTTLADALAAGYGFAFCPYRKTAAGELMGFADNVCGSAFRRDNPQLYAELDTLFNCEIPLFGYVKKRTTDAAANARQVAFEERADGVLRSPLRKFYGITAQADGKPPRRDKGRPHAKRRYADGWRKQAEVAADFNRAKFTPERGAKPRGGCTVTMVKQWDGRYPDATHAEPRCGYYGDLRITHDEQKYWTAVRAWKEYWQGWRGAFAEWRTAHRASPLSAFRYRPTKRVSVSPDQIGADADGKRYGTPDGKRKT